MRALRERGRGKGGGGKRRGLAVGCHGCSRIDYLPALHRIGESLPARVLPSLFARRIPTALHFFISLYGLIPSFPRRARYIYRLVSPSGSCLYHTATSPGPLAVRPPKLSRRHDLCFLRPSGGLIPFCCRMYTCAAAPPSLSLSLPTPFSSPPLLLPPSPFLILARSRASTDLLHTTDYPPARQAVDGLLASQVPLALRLLPRLLFSGSVTLPPSVRSFLPLTALYRLVTSVSRARDLRASALLDGRLSITTSRCPEAFTSATVTDK